MPSTVGQVAEITGTDFSPLPISLSTDTAVKSSVSPESSVMEKEAEPMA